MFSLSPPPFPGCLSLAVTHRGEIALSAVLLKLVRSPVSLLDHFFLPHADEWLLQLVPHCPVVHSAAAAAGRWTYLSIQPGSLLLTYHPILLGN